MHTSLLWGCFLIAGSCVASDVTGQRSFATCAAALKLPAYTPIARAAGDKGGSVEATFEVGADGKHKNLRLNASNKFLGDEVRLYLEDSEFLPACAGNTLVLRFTFRIAGEPHQCPLYNVVFAAPNHFIVSARPRWPSVD